MINRSPFPNRSPAFPGNTCNLPFPRSPPPIGERVRGTPQGNTEQANRSPGVRCSIERAASFAGPAHDPRERPLLCTRRFPPSRAVWRGGGEAGFCITALLTRESEKCLSPLAPPTPLVGGYGSLGVCCGVLAGSVASWPLLGGS